jgi:hypothetical protein
MIVRQLAILSSILVATSVASADGPTPFPALAKSFESDTRPILKRYCLKCHSTEAQEGDLDLEQFATLDQIRRSPRVWQKVVEMLDNGEMPPKKSPQPAPADRQKLRGWARGFLDAEALANAGDPGPVVFRRLSNVEYDNTVRDLTRIDLKPAREFPVDGAAGEGFTNVGEALAMSPSLIDKYVAAAKGIASHAVHLPDGIRFSEKASRRDWTDELVGRIRDLYRAYTLAEGSRRVNLQGLDILAETGGRIPLEAYLTVLKTNPKDLAAAAKSAGLSPKYLKTLSDLLNGTESSALIDDIRARWRTARPEEIASDIRLWQAALTKFNSVAHFKPWMEPANPINESQPFRIALKPEKDAKDMVVRLVTRNAGAAGASGLVEWKEPRLEAPGRPPILLRDLRDGLRGREAMRKTFADAAKYLIAADDARSAAAAVDVDAFAKARNLDPVMLSAWFDCLGIVRQGQLNLNGLITERNESAGAFGFVKTWGPSATPNVSANSSDKAVSIPGTLRPHSVAIHPSPTLNVAVGWRSPVEGLARVEARVVHAHPACGNGVTWTLELRRGRERRQLAGGSLDLGKAAKIAPIENLLLHPGDLLSIVVGARDANHGCDLTDVDLTIQELADSKRKWNLAHDVSGDLLAANPHADTLGNRDIWAFYTEKTSTAPNASLANIPPGSILDRWRDQPNRAERDKLAGSMQELLNRPAPAAKDSPDAALYAQLTSPTGPLLGRLDFARLAAEVRAKDETPATAEPFGLPRERFGKQPAGRPVEPTSLIADATEVIELRLPADLAAGSEIVTTAALAGSEGSVQAHVVVGTGPIPQGLAAGMPILARTGTASRQRVEKSFDEFRRIFPAALCYLKIVPVDEVVTLVLFHREDEALERLMLDDTERKTLDRLWDDLRYISQDAIKVQEAYGQFMEYVTQDGDVRLFEPLRKPIKARSVALQKRLLDTEPRHLDALVEFAALAYRRPLAAEEAKALRALYATLRTQDLDHDAAFRLTLARVLMAPAFLYHVENSAAGKDAQPVSNWELASRLSYTVWASMPDAELRRLAASGRLDDPAILASQVRRMLNDPKARALATEFACQWLDIRGFDTHDEKSERVFPEFAGLKGAMYEESIQFFADMFKNNGSLLGVLDADHTFVNDALARHYGIPGIKGPEWRRVDGVKTQGRGGVLGMASLLSKQSGASRTSPILRGNWLSEMLLGERLPRPPKNVPQLPESELDTNGLTLRQITEKHRAIESCAKCHDKIDPFGFALEGFDAIGRRRTADLGGRPIDTKAKLKDGTEFTGIDGLRDYLLKNRRDEFVRHFCRKLLGYSLGRSVQLSDEPLLAEIRRTLIDHDYHVQSAILAIVQSPQFRNRRGLESPLDHESTNP